MSQNQNLRLIVIDDNPAIHQDFMKILMTSKPQIKKDAEIQETEGIIVDAESSESLLPRFEIDTATQGREGVQKIAEAIKEGRPYALAFVDIRMPPGWDGIETVKHIWDLDSNIQIVICAAYSDYTWEETVENLGQKDNLLILKKPLDNVSVRQLACALTKKWQLLDGSKQSMAFLEKRVEQRIEDISKRASLEEELQYQATHDLLTNLPNRVLLRDRLKQAIEKYKRDKNKFALLLLDLDRFKLINDSISHQAGDYILHAVAERLKSLLRKGDTFARLGGDEFVIIVNDAKNEENLAIFANKLLSAFDEHFIIEGHEVMLSTSIGICVFPADGENVDLLLRNADIAMYHAKELGANQYQFYKAELNKQNKERLDREMELRRALEHNEFTLYYQPQFDLKTEKLVSIEALIRWNHPTKGIILPLEFIPLAEETGLIAPIGEWILRSACKQIKQWQDEGLPHIRVAINITTKQFKLYNLVQIIQQVLNETQLEPQYLELELTETMIINNLEIINMIHEIKKLGVQIVLDDFGTGYFSLNYLRQLPLDRIKIDQSYIQNIDSNRGDDVIIQAIIAMAKSMNLEVLAEGVESKNQLDFLKMQNCSEVQEFYFSQPVSAKDCEMLLKKQDTVKLWEFDKHNHAS